MKKTISVESKLKQSSPLQVLNDPAQCDAYYGADVIEKNRCLCDHFPDVALQQGIDCSPYTPIYWYHPDYIGNVEFVSDRTGQPYQHFYYAPFGDPMVSQHVGTGSFNSAFRFNAKEYDEETGNYYYGARYYEPKSSVWMGVDALATKYPSMNPYNFVMGNPIMAIDPDGNDWIFNLDNCKYEWNDNVTSGTDLHGTNMRYVGANDRDVLLDLGWTEENKSSIYKRTGLIPGDYGENWGAMYNLFMESEISISLSPFVTESSSDVSKNNLKGRVFLGLQVMISGEVNSNYPSEWGNTSGYVNGEVLLGSRSFPVNLGHTKPEIQSIEAFGQSLTLYPQTATSTGSVGSDKILLPYELLRENNNFQINLKGGWNLGGNIPTHNMFLWIITGEGVPFTPVEFDSNTTFYSRDIVNWNKYFGPEFQSDLPIPSE